ncbi:MAG: AAA family ATPase, partial [Thermocrispum sp.]
MSVLVITGTDTGVGKTVATAAVAALAAASGRRVAVVKPAQTGVLPAE